MTKYLLVTLFLCSAAMAHTHAWIKQNETQGQDAFGNAVVICSWTCYEGHYAQTQGVGFCPFPGQ